MTSLILLLDKSDFLKQHIKTLKLEPSAFSLRLTNFGGMRGHLPSAISYEKCPIAEVI